MCVNLAISDLLCSEAGGKKQETSKIMRRLCVNRAGHNIQFLLHDYCGQKNSIYCDNYRNLER